MIRTKLANDSQGLAFPDMTALLDVIFILLVFLLLTAQIAPQSLTVQLPEASSAEDLILKEDLTITLFSEKQHWALNGREYRQWQNLTEALALSVNKKPDASIVIAGDKNVSLQQLLQVFDWLKQNNLKAAEVLVD